MTPFDKGADLEPITFAIDREALVRYAGAANDFAPIHYNDEAARAYGLPGVIAHGMLSAALVAQAIERWAGAAASIIEMSNRFTAVVPVDGLLPTTMTVTGRIEGLDPDSAVLDVSLEADGRPVLANVRARVRRNKTMEHWEVS